MNAASVAPCGILCDICSGFQRPKNTCVGCNNTGNKPNYCHHCRIKLCPEKRGNEKLLCSNCDKYPCRRIKDLDKRYRTKYGESVLENLASISEGGMRAFLKEAKGKWTCLSCGRLVCVHRGRCLACGEVNPHYPKKSGRVVEDEGRNGEQSK